MQWLRWLTSPCSRRNLVSLGDIAERQSISLPYLEQLFVKLRRSELVSSVRGPGGGYRLARSPSEIRVVDILSAVDESVDAMHKGAGASGGASGSRAQSLTNRLWEGLSANVYVYLHQTRLSDVISMNWRRVLLSQICSMLWMFDLLKGGQSPSCEFPRSLFCKMNVDVS